MFDSIDNKLSKWTDFRDLRFEDLENIYQTVKLDNTPVYIIAVLIALLFGLINLLRHVESNVVTSKQVDLGTFVKILKEKWYFFAVITLMPFAFSFLEVIFGLISNYVPSKEPDASIYNGLKQQVEMLAQKENNGSIWDINVGEFVLDAIDYIIVLSITPMIVFYIESAYSAALTFRFFFLGCVEMIGFIAVACLLNEKTKMYFYNWCKALLISYLMIPAFLFANGLTDAIYSYMLLQTDVYNWIFPLLLLSAGLKTVVFAAVPVVLFRIF